MHTPPLSLTAMKLHMKSTNCFNLSLRTKPLGLGLLLAWALSAQAAPAAATASAAPTNAPTAALTITHGPFLQAPSADGVTVSWATSAKCLSWVEYRPESASQWLTNSPTHQGLVDADVTYHNVPLTGLRPGTPYVYRAVSRAMVSFLPSKVTYGGVVASAEHRFTTFNADKPDTAFVVVNDRHEHVPQLNASLAAVQWTNVDVAFLNGDMVNAVREEPLLYQCIIDPCVQNFASAIPVVYVRGNHDTRGSFARHLMEFFPTDSGRYYYTLRQGPVAFLVLDSGEDKSDQDVAYAGLVAFEPYLEQELQWLARQLQDPAFQSAPFRVCLMHIPPKAQTKPQFIRVQWLLDHVVPLLNQGKVDLLLCAHTHKYALHPAGTGGRQFPLLIGGTETVIRCDATEAQLSVSATDLSGQTLPQLGVLRRHPGP